MLLSLLDEYISWIPTKGIPPPGGSVAVAGSIYYITRVPHNSGAVKPSFSYQTESYYTNEDESVMIVNLWYTMIVESGTVIWQDYRPGEVLPPTAIVTGHVGPADGGEFRPGMYDPRMKYALIPSHSSALQVNVFQILTFRHGEYPTQYA